MPILIVDDYLALKSPVTQKEVGYIHSTICYGTPIQVNKLLYMKQIYRYQQGQKKIIPFYEMIKNDIENNDMIEPKQ